MIGSSVVPGLPKRCVTPSDCSNSTKALRPLIVFGVEGDVIQTARRTRGWSNVALPARPRQWPAVRQGRLRSRIREVAVMAGPESGHDRPGGGDQWVSLAISAP